MFTQEQVQLLQQMATSGDQFTFVTQEQGQSLSAAGYIVVDATQVQGNTLGAKITDQGVAYLNSLQTAQPVAAAAPVAAAPVQAAQPVAAPPMQVVQPEATISQPTLATTDAQSNGAGEFKVETVPRPVTKKQTGGANAGRKSKYPYDQLEIDQSFFVPDSACSGDAHKTMSSSVAAQNKKHRVNKIIGWSQNEQGQYIPQYQPEIDPKTNQQVVDKNGHGKFVQVNTKRFRSYKVEKNEVNPEGGARVFRQPLKESDAQVPRPDLAQAAVQPATTA